MYLLMRVKSLMSLKVWSNLGPTNQILKSPFSGDFPKIMPKVYRSGILEPKFLNFPKVQEKQFYANPSRIRLVKAKRATVGASQVNQAKQIQISKQSKTKKCERSSE